MRVPEPPPPDVVGEVVAACADHPDFTTYPGATEDEIAAAEDALDIRFPDHYRAFLAATNGMSVLRGKTSYFGVGPNAVVDLVEFNRPDGWLAKLPDGWLTPEAVVWTGANPFQDLIGIARRDRGRVAVSLLGRQDFDNWGPNAVGTSFTMALTSWFERGFAGTDAGWRRAHKKVGDVALDESLVWGPMFYMNGGEPDLRGLRKTRLTLALRITAELSADLEELGEDADIYDMMVPYVDDGGVPRVRWATPERDPDGPPSVVTVDGEVP